MNREAKRRMLEDYSFYSIEMQKLLDTYNELFTVATHITQSFSEGTGVHDNDSKIEKRAMKLVQISKRIEKLKAKQRRIDKAMAKLKPYHRYLILKIDINGLSVSKVAKQTNRDVSSIIRTHNRALDALDL